LLGPEMKAEASRSVSSADLDRLGECWAIGGGGHESAVRFG